MPSVSRISSGTSVAVPPTALMASSSSSNPPGVRAVATTCAPSRASAIASAWPMPREPPVTSAMREARGLVMRLLFLLDAACYHTPLRGGYPSEAGIEKRAC